MTKLTQLRNALKNNRNESAHGIYRFPFACTSTVCGLFTLLFIKLLGTALYSHEIAGYLVFGRVTAVPFASEPWLFSISIAVALLMIPACLYSVYLFWVKSDLNCANNK